MDRLDRRPKGVPRLLSLAACRIRAQRCGVRSNDLVFLSATLSRRREPCQFHVKEQPMHGLLETLSVEVDLCAPGWERIIDRASS